MTSFENLAIALICTSWLSGSLSQIAVELRKISTELQKLTEEET